MSAHPFSPFKPDMMHVVAHRIVRRTPFHLFTLPFHVSRFTLHISPATNEVNIP